MPRRRETKRKLFDCDPVLAERIKNFRHLNRIATESGAIRQLIVAGLAQLRQRHRTRAQNDLMERIKANGVGPCSDPVILEAIAASKDYMVDGLFVPIDPDDAEEALISGEPLDLVWPTDVDVRNHAAMAELYRNTASETGRSVGETYHLLMALRQQKREAGL